MTPKEYRNELLAKTKSIYINIGKIYCPCLREDIYFNADGLNHLLNEFSGRPRTVEEQIYKLKLLPLVIPTIKKCTIIDEKRDEAMRVSRKKNAPVKKVQYWALVHVVGRRENVKVKVIIRKVGDGKYIFWSAMKLKK